MRLFFIAVLLSSCVSSQSRQSSALNNTPDGEIPKKPNALPVTATNFSEAQLSQIANGGKRYCKDAASIKKEFETKKATLSADDVKYVEGEMTLAANFCTAEGEFKLYDDKNALNTINERFDGNLTALDAAYAGLFNSAKKIGAPPLFTLNHNMQVYQRDLALFCGATKEKFLDELENPPGGAEAAAKARTEHSNFTFWIRALNDWYKTNKRD